MQLRQFVGAHVEPAPRYRPVGRSHTYYTHRRYDDRFDADRYDRRVGWYDRNGEWHDALGDDYEARRYGDAAVGYDSSMYDTN